MIPGWHFNWLQNEKSYVTPLGGIQHFYKQMLIGDKTDNIFGVTGIGPVKDVKIFFHCSKFFNCFFNVYPIYTIDGFKSFSELFSKNNEIQVASIMSEHGVSTVLDFLIQVS